MQHAKNICIPTNYEPGTCDVRVAALRTYFERTNAKSNVEMLMLVRA